jgi:anti-sigma regulatory factor (Ser/Thr protein kinase)
VADPDRDDCVLSTPPDDARVLRYRADLAGVRAFAAAAARQAGLMPGRARDFVIAVSELAGNTLAHTKGPGTLTVWSTRHELIGQVRDAGHITGPRPGQAGPGAVGHGLWVVRQVCDRVQIRTGSAGTVIEVSMRLSPSPAG